MTTIIDIKAWRNGWKVFECAGVEPVFLVKDQALDYAKKRDPVFAIANNFDRGIQ